MIAQSTALTLFVIAGNTLLRPLVNAIDRIPLSAQDSEANYEVIVTTNANSAADIRDALSERLDAAKYPIRETNVIYRPNDNVEISARLVSLAVDPKDLDTVVAELSRLGGVRHATWNVSALE
jgi:putative Mg2+ transporter-C (MgtC) family protein